ncbi:MAG TPA: hypothetical protein P5077_05035 [bacterium]|nr:hypothetical protein [bacterium]
MRPTPLFFLLLLLSACAPDLPELPADIEYSAGTDYRATCDGETPDDDILCDAGTHRYRGRCVAVDLVIATTAGYDAPRSGRILIAPDERLDDLRELAFPVPLGGSDGTDLTLATAGDRLMVVGRDGADTVWVYEPREGTPRFTTIPSPVAGYANFHDALWNGARYIVSANELDRLLLFDEKGSPAGEIPLAPFAPDGIGPAPSALLRNGDRAYAALQLIGDNWLSRGGRIARFERDGTPLTPMVLPLANPTSKLAVEPLLSPDRLFVSCSGSYQSRDGGIVRVDLFTGETTVILRETTEELSPLNVKVGDLAVTPEGDIYFTAFDDDWRGHLQVLRRDGTVRRIASDINVFAAIPLEASPFTGRIYFFDQRSENDTIISRLNALDTGTGKVTTTPIPDAPAALRIWIREITTTGNGERP